MPINNTAEVRYALQYGQKFPTNAPLVLTEPVVIKGPDGPPGIIPDVPGKRVKFIFNGSGDAPFILQDTRGAHYQGIDIDIQAPCEAGIIAERVTTGPGVTVSTALKLSDVRIRANSIGERGVWYRVPVSDQNNEHGSFKDLEVDNVVEEAIRIDGWQSKEHVFLNCRLNTGKIGVVSNSGSFHMLGGTVTGMTDSAFVLNTPTDFITIEAVSSESCNRFLRKTDATTDMFPVQIINCRIACDMLNADRFVIIFNAAGPLNIQGGKIGDGGQAIGKIQCQPLGSGVLRLLDVCWSSNGSFEDKANLLDLGGGMILRQDVCFYRTAAGAVRHQFDT